MAKTTKKAEAQKQLPGRSEEWQYVLDWIQEAVDSRAGQIEFIERAIHAYQTKPSKNRYKGTITSYAKEVHKNDANRAKEIKALADEIPEKGSVVVQNAIETIVSMAQGGVGQYRFAPYDPDMSRDDELIDRLSAAAKSFYDQNKVDAILPQFIRNAALAGVGHLHVKQKKGKKVVTLMDPTQMLTDPKRFKTSAERFIGFSQRESFANIKDRVTKTKGGYVLKTLNEAEVYVAMVRQELNSVLNQGGNTATATYLHTELSSDVDMFYKAVIGRFMERRKDENNPALMYEGDEVEISYIYDLMNDKFFEIINRKYVIVAKDNPLTRTIKCKYYDAKGKEKTKDKVVRLDHPFVELPYNKLFWSRYPVSPLFYVLDDFDDLCAMESVLYHNLSIMAPVTFVGQSADAEKVSRVASVAGEVVEGLPQTFGVLNKTHDITPVTVAIQRYEERIKRVMKAVDPFELQGMIGDRATAKEVVSASGQVSQGMNPFIANIEAAMATLGDKFIKLELINNDNDTYGFDYNGKYIEVTREELAKDYEISAKLVSSIKLEQEANSRKALELVQYLGQSEAVDKKQFLGTMIPIILGDLVSREQALSMVLPEYRPMPEEVIAAIREKAEEDARKDEADRLNLDGMSDADLDAMALEIGGMPDATIAGQAGGGMFAQAPSTSADPNAFVPNPVPSEQEAAGIVANDQTGAGYAL